MDPATQRQLDQIVSRVVETVPTKAIYLFGSFARGDQRNDSDLDIYILTDNKKRPIDYIHDIRSAISPLEKIPVDILAMPWQMFEQRAAFKPTLEYTVVKEGRKLYG